MSKEAKSNPMNTCSRGAVFEALKSIELSNMEGLTDETVVLSVIKALKDYGVPNKAYFGRVLHREKPRYPKTTPMKELEKRVQRVEFLMSELLTYTNISKINP